MKKMYIYKNGVTALLLCALAGSMPVSAEATAADRLSKNDTNGTGGVTVSDVNMRRNGKLMSVDMNIGMADLRIASNRAAVFTPVIVSSDGRDSLHLQAVTVYGRTRWYQQMRAGTMPLGGEAETAVRWADRPDIMSYAQTVPYAAWMNGAKLAFVRSDYGCCRTLLDEQSMHIGGWREVRFTPQYRYVSPAPERLGAGGKMRELSGRAFIDFPVNRTEIYPEYRNNPAELAKIIATIDSIRNDKDITVSALSIKGYASPEGAYDNNTRLAKGRTAALKQYVQKLYRFDDGFIATDYEPEDWEGLRAFVETSGLEHRKEILDIIDEKTLEPDAREWRLKSRYPEEYRFLLQTVYPGLRHSDYRIEYTIRQFTDIAEIRRMMTEAPQKLSLEEMFRLAQTLTEGSDEYNEVFETAVRMFPADETANLNAANAAMQRGDIAKAERYLGKAGKSAEALYARGMLKAMQGDYDAAERMIRQAAAAGMAGTEGIISHLHEVKAYAAEK